MSITQVNKIILVSTPNKFYYYDSQTPKLRAYPLSVRADSVMRLSGILVRGGLFVWSVAWPTRCQAIVAVCLDGCCEGCAGLLIAVLLLLLMLLLLLGSVRVPAQPVLLHHWGQAVRRHG